MNKTTKMFDIDGIQFRFDLEAFKGIFRKSAKKSRTSLAELERELANTIFVSPSSVHAWRMDINGPGDLDKIQSIANFFNVTLATLLVETKENDMSENYTDRQLEAIRRIYTSIMLYLDEFVRSNGFNDYWFDVVQKEGVDPENAETRLYEIAEAAQHRVEFATMCERLDLKGLRIYDELMDYIYDDLTDLYNGKLSYGYRFEAQASRYPESDSSMWEPTTDEDFEKAIKRLDGIIDKFM